MNNKKLIILYGSQTGTSQDLAERIWKTAKSNNHSTSISSFDKFDLKNLNANTILLGVCSTTGDGVEPDNMQLFWKKIMKKSLPTQCLSSLDFAVIGLGDSSYEKFNFTAKKLNKRLIQLGAHPLLDVCLCDEQHSQGIEATFSDWIKKFWQIISFKHEKISNFYKHKIINKTEQVNNPQSLNECPSELNPFKSKLLKNERSTSIDHWQNVRLIELEIDSKYIQYEAGDVCMIRPSNPKHVVDKFKEMFSHLNLNMNERIKIETNFNDFESCGETNEYLIQTVQDLIEKYFDLNSVPKMSFFETFEQLSTDELEKEKLNDFLSPEGTEDLNNYCYRSKRTILEVFSDFPKTTNRITSLDILIELIPSIKPRAFSIASNPFVHKNVIQLLVAVVEYKTRLHETRKGTCSYWLSTLEPTNNQIIVPIWIKKGSFKFDYSKPLICIGPGTGVAPFRSILNERIFKHDLKENHLYFGCRSKQADYYFESEWNEINQNKPGYLNVNVAFSRDTKEKIYVQDKLYEDSKQVFNLINNLNCYILLAGNAKRMPQDVLSYLEKILKENLLTDDDTIIKNYINNLKTNKRIQMETWS